MVGYVLNFPSRRNWIRQIYPQGVEIIIGDRVMNSRYDSPRLAASSISNLRSDGASGSTEPSSFDA